MNMGFGFSMRHRVVLEQHIEQMLKLELKHEIKLVLKQILALLKKIRLSQRITREMIGEIDKQLQGCSHEDQQELCHEVVRRGGMEATMQLAYVMEFAGTKGGGGESNARLIEFAFEIRNIVTGEELIRHTRVRRACALALRMVLRAPTFWEGKPPTADNLRDLLTSIPQNDGAVVWALAGGWAVELLLGAAIRDHHDIDTIVLLPGRAVLSDTDKVHTDDYFGVLSCTSTFVRRNCITEVEWDGFPLKVWVLCPEFLLLSKLLNSDREKDWLDVTALIRKFGCTLNIGLIRKLLKRNSCGFTRSRELIRILEQKDTETVITELAKFHRTM